jgi:hypothetical protein
MSKSLDDLEENEEVLDTLHKDIQPSSNGSSHVSMANKLTSLDIKRHTRGIGSKLLHKMGYLYRWWTCITYTRISICVIFF